LIIFATNSLILHGEGIKPRLGIRKAFTILDHEQFHLRVGGFILGLLDEGCSLLENDDSITKIIGGLNITNFVMKSSV
jgi:hypothetical protein